MRSNKKMRQDAECAWQQYSEARKEYDKTFVLWRVFKARPAEPGAVSEQALPSLEDWHRHFIELRVRPGLDEVLIMDAGGYSLDVYARARHGSQPKEFTRSFAAGG